MPVKLEGIKFNYDTDLTKTGAFNLRRNETQLVRIPEWPPEHSSDFKASPAAYAMCGLPANMTIQASFECDGGLKTPLLVRAVSEFPNVLGDVEPLEIPNNCSSGFVTLKLPDARVSCAGVGIHDIAWRWQFSDQPQLWTDFQTTHHRVYTVLARPWEPWEPKSTDPSNVHQPWTEVLEYVCQWAAGAAAELDQAAELVTKNFFKSVAKLANYAQGASYAFSRFNCTNFLSLLNTGTGGNQTVNCDDCASVVSTFANILGCQLSQSSFATTEATIGLGFRTHPVVLIGDEDFEPTSFFYHSVAWKGECKENDEVFDGCLQIDENLKDPLIAVQPTNLPFGTEEAGYRFSVVRDSPRCRPIPDHPDYGRRRRKIRKGYLADRGIEDQELLSKLKDFYDFDSWPKVEDETLQGDSNKILLDIFKETLFADWAFRSGEHFQDERFFNVLQVLLQRPDFLPGELIDLNLYQTHKNSDPNLNLLEILARFEKVNFKRLINPELGDVVFVDPDRTTVVFRRARFLVVVRSAGRRPVPVIEIATALERVVCHTI